MKRQKINYAVDMLMLVSALICFLTGMFKFYPLARILGINYSAFPMRIINIFHDWSGIAIGIFAIIHTILHWQWICVMTKNIFKRKQQ